MWKALYVMLGIKQDWWQNDFIVWSDVDFLGDSLLNLFWASGEEEVAFIEEMMKGI